MFGYMSHKQIHYLGATTSATADATAVVAPPSCRPLSCCVSARATPPPGDRECLLLWQRHAMPRHIQTHSALVAAIAEHIALRARERGMCDCVQTVKAAALLHDIAKDYTIRFGGNHAQLGGVWALEATGNPALAQGVVHHVFWPWELDPTAFFLPLTVIYADKRVQHDRVVSVRERFHDLFDRYATSEWIRGRIMLSLNQALELERVLGQLLEIDLDACTFDCGRLVQRT